MYKFNNKNYLIYNKRKKFFVKDNYSKKKIILRVNCISDNQENFPINHWRKRKKRSNFEEQDNR